VAPRVRECAQDERPLEFALETVADATLAANERLRELVIERMPPIGLRGRAFGVACRRHADLRGYSYGREDVKARDLANAYSQSLSTIFTQQMKPYEVEILVGEVDGDVSGTTLYHVMFDGSVTDEHGFIAIGGHAEDLTESLKQHYQEGWDLATAVKTGISTLGAPDQRQIEASDVEAGVLDRTRAHRRKFRRLDDAEVSAILTG